MDSKDIKRFKDNLERFAACYNPSELFAKIKKLARKVGEKTIYGLPILYYSTFDKALPIKDRLMVIAALGYFIVPLDIIPDALPLGFSDDAAAIAYVVRHIWKNLSPSTFKKARKRLEELFPNQDPASFENESGYLPVPAEEISNATNKGNKAP